MDNFSKHFDESKSKCTKEWFSRLGMGYFMTLCNQAELHDSMGLEDLGTL